MLGRAVAADRPDPSACLCVPAGRLARDKLGCEGIVSKRVGSPYRRGRSADWIKVKDPAAPAAKREAEKE